MKKLLIIVTLLMLGVIFFNKETYNLTEDAIRFRVIANSNSAVDILMKEKVVSELSNILFKNYSKEETRINIFNNVELIENKINKLFEENNYEKTFNISYGLNDFPEKEYNGVIYEEGLYESLVIEIGEGKGNNYWCFLYPSLCMIDYESEDENIKYELKIFNMLKNIF